MILTAHSSLADLGQTAIEQSASIVIGSDDAIIGKNLDGVMTSWNHGAEKIFGYTAQEAIGKNIEILIPPEHLKDEFHILKQILLGKRVSHFEAARLCKDGRRITVSMTASPIFDGGGKVIGASKIARDITSQKNSAEALLAANKELDLGMRWWASLCESGMTRSLMVQIIASAGLSIGLSRAISF